MNNIEYLSCREESGKDLIKKIAVREARVVLDPTLLLSREDWIEIEKESTLYNEREFILVYFLGNKIKYIDEINEFAKDRGLEIIEVFDGNTVTSMSTTPDEFIWLLRRASYVFTDSFHATVFSIIFKRKFLVFRRIETGMEKMFDRIQTLLAMYGLNNRIYTGCVDSIHSDIKDTINSEQVDRSISYLREILDLD